MPYTGVYSLGTRCLTEFLGTFVAIALGESILANELLPTTKGHAMGYSGVAFGFGMAFTFAIQMFGYASAHLNPAMCLALWIRDSLSFTDFLALSLSEFAGALCGAVFVYALYLPHFRTIPEAQGSTEDVLLRSRDQIDPQALRFASYSTKPNYKSALKTKTVSQRVMEAKYYLLNETFDSNPETVLNHLIGGTYALHGSEVPFPDGSEGINRHNDIENKPVQKIRRRHSLQVADLQRLLRKMEKDLGKETSFELDTRQIPDVPTASTNTVQNGTIAAPTDNWLVSTGFQIEDCGPVSSREEALGRAAIAADQAAKLSVFATRPAIFLPIHNIFVEMMGTMLLILGAIMIDNRLDMITDAASRQADGIQIGPFLVGMYIMCLILAVGGPTGFAANPARDFAPRIAHFLLPIPGKGTSELGYGLLIALAAFAGGAIAGGLTLALDEIP
ncbi:hypothetical protein HK100_006311 [Physocladia obscura]|uniref:Aquaporin n=1 Tax=Physocladia obscura TaxID=109957 RepID=A0AAD5XG67_9FUNG|nr:hypothetical protein HK100_006311 [Physocladia obscura]